MKKTIIFIILIAICSCRRSNTNAVVSLPINPIDTNNSMNEVVFESIDTAEFIVYWKLFRKAILDRDTATLSTLINNSIDGWFLQNKFNKSPLLLDKFNKSLLLNNLDSLFTPGFLSLLKSYEIEKYIRSNWENMFLEKKEKKIYKSYMMFAYVQMIPNKIDFHRVVFYTMFFRRENEVSEKYYPKNNGMKNDYSEKDFFAFELMFVKSNAGIRLYRLVSYDAVDISD